MLQPKPWRLDHPTCPLGIHRQPCTAHESLVNSFSAICPEHAEALKLLLVTEGNLRPSCITAEPSADNYGTKRHEPDDVSWSAGMAIMVGFLQFRDDFGLFWLTLADGVSQWPRLQSMSLAGTHHVDVISGLHDLVLQSSHVVDQIWHSRCWSQ